jgi:holin-like protein
MLETLAALLVFQTIGEVLSYALKLPVPGPVLGMILLLALLLARPATVARLRPTSLELLKHLSLLFVPAGVGVMLHIARIGREWLPIVVALVASTALAIAVTALVVTWTARRLGHSVGDDPPAGRNNDTGH